MVSGGPTSRFAYLIGGATKGSWTGACFRYDTHNDTYDELAPAPTERRRSAAVLVQATCEGGGGESRGGSEGPDCPGPPGQEEGEGEREAAGAGDGPCGSSGDRKRQRGVGVL